MVAVKKSLIPPRRFNCTDRNQCLMPPYLRVISDAPDVGAMRARMVLSKCFQTLSYLLSVLDYFLISCNRTNSHGITTISGYCRYCPRSFVWKKVLCLQFFFRFRDQLSLATNYYKLCIRCQLLPPLRPKRTQLTLQSHKDYSISVTNSL